MEYSIGVVHISCLEFAYPIENLSDKNVKIYHHVNITFYSFIVVTNFTFSNYEITSVKINIGWVLKKGSKQGGMFNLILGY